MKKKDYSEHWNRWYGNSPVYEFESGEWRFQIVWRKKSLMLYVEFQHHGQRVRKPLLDGITGVTSMAEAEERRETARLKAHAIYTGHRSNT